MRSVVEQAVAGMRGRVSRNGRECGHAGKRLCGKTNSVKTGLCVAALGGKKRVVQLEQNPRCTHVTGFSALMLSHFSFSCSDNGFAGSNGRLCARNHARSLPEEASCRSQLLCVQQKKTLQRTRCS